MKTPAEAIADCYDDIIKRCDSAGKPSRLSSHERVIYYVVSTRCEMDMNGFGSVFDQLLTEDELVFLIQSLEELGETGLKDSFQAAHEFLTELGFFEKSALMTYDLPENQQATLEMIEDRLRAEERLWELDEKLLGLIPE